MNPTSALKRVALSDPRPTQASVGYRQVMQKREEGRSLSKKQRRKLVTGDFDRALAKARRLARLEDASYLPGWCGRSG
jgi:hypothetical protein